MDLEKSTSEISDSASEIFLSKLEGGANQSDALESALNNLETYTENLASATSNIRDADFAFETAEMSKLQVMQQAGTAILGQATRADAVAERVERAVANLFHRARIRRVARVARRDDDERDRVRGIARDRVARDRVGDVRRDERAGDGSTGTSRSLGAGRRGF